jgi:hypothetical protein
MGEWAGAVGGVEGEPVGMKADRVTVMGSLCQSQALLFSRIAARKFLFCISMSHRSSIVWVSLSTMKSLMATNV